MFALPSDPTELTKALLALRAQGVGAVDRVVLFGSGLHREGDEPYTRQDVADILANFQSLSTGPEPRLPVLIDLDHEGAGPRVGTVTRLWEEPGGVLCAQFGDLPQLFADAIKQRLWFRVSAAIKPEPPFGLPGTGKCLVGAALLGAQPPALKWTGQLSGVRPYADPPRIRCWSERVGDTTFVYSEAATVDRKALEEKLKALGWSDAMVKAASDGITDDAAFGTFVTEALAEKAAPAGAGGAGGNNPPMDKPAMIDAIIAADPTQDRAALEAMSDADLQALYAKVTGGTYGEEEEEGTPPPKPPVPAGLDAKAIAAFAERSVRTAVKTAERAIMSRLAVKEKALDARLAAEAKASADREAAERRKGIDVFCESAVGSGHLTPADLDESDPKTAHLSVRQRLYRMDATPSIQTFGEGGKPAKKSQLEIEMAAILAKPPKTYGEKLRAAGGDGVGKEFYDAIREQAAKGYAARNALPEIPLHTRLGMLPPRHLR
jgi:hypothetical protein